MAAHQLKVAILIVSDTASRDPATDKVGDILTETIAATGTRWGKPTIAIVPDDELDIKRHICRWADAEVYYNLIITSGGTGFGLRDNTPERQDWFAMMSRPVAGVRHHTLIVTVPGSPKGAKECVEAIINLLPHACLQAAGADSRSLHAGGVEKLEREAGVSGHHGHDHCHHHHGGHGGHIIPKPHINVADTTSISNDPTIGPARRNRSSPYPMISVDEALKLIHEHTPSPIIIETPVDVSLVGSVIAEDVYAAESVPAYRASIVDGYAVIAPDTKGQFPVTLVSHAQAASMPPPLEYGSIARITTGAPLPDNANAVVMVEDTVLVSTIADGTEEAVVEILTGDVKPGENIREPGSDVKKGSLILAKGDLITAVGGEIGLLASTGVQKVKIYQKPCIGVLSTGDELVRHNFPVTLIGGQIRDSNKPSLISCLKSWGFKTIDLGITKDTTGQLEEILRDAFRGTTPANLSGVDVVITTGGVSMGELDLLKPTIERKLGGTIHFGRVSMKPGKPTTFATIPFKPATQSDPDSQQERETRLIFSLPGNPASALVTLNLFVLPSLHKAMGYQPAATSLPEVKVSLTHDIPKDPKRTEYHRAVVGVSDLDGRLLATSTGITGVGQRSSRVGSLARANALLVLEPGTGSFEKGQMVRALMMGQVMSVTGISDH
ncbi:hypothetical protein FQN57_000780 [Myotisia sp. PD_48]|nr:hypothetical protein FQN57_000780 [Myotisia sp. PD_48]